MRGVMMMWKRLLVSLMAVVLLWPGTAYGHHDRDLPHEGTSEWRELMKWTIAENWHGNDLVAIDVVGCESVGLFDPKMHDFATGYRFHGPWQFTLPTWDNAFGVHDPHDASMAQQTQRAWEVYQARGLQPWPECGQAEHGTWGGG